MITMLTFLLMIFIFGRLGMFALKATWGIGKILVTLIFLPLMIVGFLLSGLFIFAIPLLIIVGIVTLIFTATS